MSCAKSSAWTPLEFRLLNSAKEGTRRPTGPVNPKVGFIETLQAVKDHPHYASKLEGPYRGRGVATGFWHNGTGPSSAIAIVNPDGTVRLVEGSPDIGGTRASASQMLAEVLGITTDEVYPTVGDTDSIGFTSTTGGSNTTFKTGWASYEAAQDIVRQMRERAARIWECDVQDVKYEDAVLTHASDSEKTLTFKQMGGAPKRHGRPDHRPRWRQPQWPRTLDRRARRGCGSRSRHR